MSVVTKAAAPIVDTAADGEERRSLERLVKMFARFVGTGYVAYFLILLPEIRRTAFLTPTWWNWFCVIAVFGTGLLFGLSSFSGSIRAIRMAGSIAAVTYLLCVLGWWLAWDQTLFDVQGVYLSTFPGLASLAAASVWPPVLVFVHMTVGVIAAQSINYVLREPFVTTPLFADIVFGMMFCTIFVAATLAALRTARILDATITRTQAQAARSAAAAARAVERERFDALTHDGVMSSLLSVARQGRSPSVVNQARLTLRQLDSLRTHSAPTSVDADEAIAQLRATANDVDESVIVHISRYRKRRPPTLRRRRNPPTLSVPSVRHWQRRCATASAMLGRRTAPSPSGRNRAFCRPRSPMTESGSTGPPSRRTDSESRSASRADSGNCPGAPLGSIRFRDRGPPCISPGARRMFPAQQHSDEPHSGCPRSARDAFSRCICGGGVLRVRMHGECLVHSRGNEQHVADPARSARLRERCIHPDCGTG